jgi:hypothetical protein
MLIDGCYGNEGILDFNNSFDYSIEQSLSCFCPGSHEPARLFIKSDSIVDAVWLSNNIHLSYSERQRFRTIKGLFDYVEHWDSLSSEFQVDVVYDSVYQYPSIVSVYPKPVVINDTVAVVITDADFSYRTWNYIEYNHE